MVAQPLARPRGTTGAGTGGRTHELNRSGFSGDLVS
jgi:hypothetical protein